MKELNSAGYDLSEVSENEWIFSVRGGSLYVGSFIQIVMIMVMKFGFDIDNIDEAVEEMVKKEKDSVHFGMYRSMIYPYNREDNLKKVS
jgi:hypothetical protein